MNCELYRTEREKYARHRHKADKFPAKYLSIIIDGMDQDKTDVPHIISHPKAMSGAYTLDTHVTGIRAHGRCIMMAIDYGQFPHDSNLTIEIMIRLFYHLKVCVYNACTFFTYFYHAGLIASSPLHTNGQHV